MWRSAQSYPVASCRSVGEAAFFWLLFFAAAKKSDSGAAGQKQGSESNFHFLLSLTAVARLQRQTRRAARRTRAVATRGRMPSVAIQKQGSE